MEQLELLFAGIWLLIAASSAVSLWRMLGYRTLRDARHALTWVQQRSGYTHWIFVAFTHAAFGGFFWAINYHSAASLVLLNLALLWLNGVGLRSYHQRRAQRIIALAQQ
jgi:hypothetical protein